MRKGILIATIVSLLPGCAVSRVTVRLVHGVPTVDVRFETNQPSQERRKENDADQNNQARV